MNHKSRATRPRWDLTAINSLEDMSRYASAHHQPVVVVPGDSLTNADTAKLTGPRTFADKRWVGPVKLLCIIMFNISKIRPKSLLGPVKAQKFSRCLQMVTEVVLTALPWHTDVRRFNQVTKYHVPILHKYVIILGCPVIDHLTIITQIDNIGKLYGQRLTYLHNLQRVYCMQYYIKPQTCQSWKKYRRNSNFYYSWSTCHPTWRLFRWSIGTAHARISREKSLCMNYDNYL